MKRNNLVIEYLNVDSLIPYVNNSRTHTDEQVKQICSSIKEFGFTNPLLIDDDGGIIAGHGRLLAAQKLGLDNVPTITLSGLTEAQKKAYVIADNQLALNAGWNEELLKIEIERLEELDFNIDLLGFDDSFLNDLLKTDDPTDNTVASKGSLSDRFLIPPFSVLSARDGWWQDRKRAWLALGIKSENGRDDELTYSKNLSDPSKYKKYSSLGSTSVFDPVLCELAYKWFSPKDGVIIDPFAGGSVRGVVASKLGRQYIGCDLRQEQVDENRIQADQICFDDEYQPIWHATDSRLIDKVCKGVEADFIFTCPPYADLEVYSDDPKDISTLPYEQFREAYFEIINKSCSLLKDNRFACIVVGEVRDKKGNYYNFVSDTIDAFKQAGLAYYNEAILVTIVGSLSMRCARGFTSSRKLGKTHQNVLVFVKGDAKKATENLGEIDVYFPEEEQNEDDS
ncbi:DNA methyltransferase [Gallibacterium sp. ZY190522]